MPTDTTLIKLLLPTATAAERTRGLLSLLSPVTLADATGVKISSLRNWASGQSQPRPEAALALDDLRAVAKVLLDGNIEPKRVSAWLTSRDPDSWEGMRPVETIRIDPMGVLGAAHDVVLQHEKRAEEVKQRRPELAAVSS